MFAEERIAEVGYKYEFLMVELCSCKRIPQGGDEKVGYEMKSKHEIMPLIKDNAHSVKSIYKADGKLHGANWYREEIRWEST